MAAQTGLSADASNGCCHRRDAHVGAFSTFGPKYRSRGLWLMAASGRLRMLVALDGIDVDDVTSMMGFHQRS